jgi:biopolymer transport protein ExbD
MRRVIVVLLVLFAFSGGLASASSDAILYRPGLNCIRPTNTPQGIWGDIPIFVRIAISPNGEKRWNGTRVSERDFASYIKDAAAQDYQPVMVVEALPATTVATVLPVLEQLQRAGLWKVKLTDTRH